MSIELFKLGLTPGRVYLLDMSDQQNFNSSIPHYFVLVSKDYPEQVFLTCCTSQWEKAEDRIKSHNLKPESVIFFDGKEYSGFKVPKRTAVNCNQLFPLSLEALYSKCKDPNTKDKPLESMPDNLTQQILSGVHASDRIPKSVKNRIAKPR